MFLPERAAWHELEGCASAHTRRLRHDQWICFSMCLLQKAGVSFQSRRWSRVVGLLAGTASRMTSTLAVVESTRDGRWRLNMKYSLLLAMVTLLTVTGSNSSHAVYCEGGSTTCAAGRCPSIGAA